MLGNNEHGLECLRRLNGKLHIIYGNHDSNVRKTLYMTLPNVECIHGWAHMIHYRKYHFYLSHFPTETANLEAESLHQCILSLSGHTHSKEKFRNDVPMYYNVALDANDNTPVLLDDIIERMKEKVQECLSYL